MPPGFRTRPYLGQSRLSVGDMRQNGMAMSNIERIIFEGKVGNVGDLEGGIVVSTSLSSGLRYGYLRFLYVYAMQLSGFDGTGQSDGYGAWATAKIEHRKSGLQVWGDVRPVPL